ncbi:MAG: hypothetical protein AAF429_08645 [Pseudomonadota bacterium]
MRARYLILALGLIFATGIVAVLIRLFPVNQAGIGLDSLRETASQRAFAYAPISIMALASMGYFSIWVTSFLTKSERTFFILERTLWVAVAISAAIIFAIVYLTL